MVKCIDCKHQHSSITKEPCRSCIVTDDKPGFELRPPDVVTNEEWIKNLNSHDFAIFLAEIMDCEYCKNELHLECNYSCEIAKWLEQEHKE